MASVSLSTNLCSAEMVALHWTGKFFLSTFAFDILSTGPAFQDLDDLFAATYTFFFTQKKSVKKLIRVVIFLYFEDGAACRVYSIAVSIFVVILVDFDKYWHLTNTDIWQILTSDFNKYWHLTNLRQAGLSSMGLSSGLKIHPPHSRKQNQSNSHTEAGSTTDHKHKYKYDFWIKKLAPKK